MVYFEEVENDISNTKIILYNMFEDNLHVQIDEDMVEILNSLDIKLDSILLCSSLSVQVHLETHTHTVFMFFL